MEALINAFRSLGPGRILALFIGFSATAFITGMVIKNLDNPGLALLYGGLNQQEASAITQYLGSQSISFEVKGDGAVYVPANQVGQLRLQVAGQGLVGGGNSGYELFDSASAFGTTNFVQNLNAKRALEGELARTIGTIPAVTGARVHIVMPKQNLFSNQTVEPSAAVALNVGQRILEEKQVYSIAQLVAAAVPNLTTQNVTIIDQRGSLLYDGKESNAAGAMANHLRQQVEKQYEQSLTAMLEKVVGPGKAVVHVTADVNADQTQETSDIYDPAQQVVRSEQQTESSNNSSDAGSGGLTGVQGNTPGGATGGAASGGSSAETRTETTTNYEVGKTVRQLTRGGGEIKKLSVAVMVEGKSAEDANGQAAYTPTPPDQLERLKKLVETAIGFDNARGDKVDIADMQFTAPPEAAAIEEPFMTKAQMLQMGQYALLLIALIVVAIMIVKPTLSILLQALATVPAPAMPPVIQQQQQQMIQQPEESTIDMRAVQGRVKESMVKKVNEVIDQHPEESLNVVRNWMAQGNRGSSPTEGG